MQQLCPFCGRASHPRTDCPARTASCYSCRKRGHFENVCCKKRRVNGKHTKKHSASSIELHAVAGERPNTKFVEILADGCSFSFKVDSGAEVLVVPITFAGAPLKLQDPKSKLKGPGNHILPVRHLRRYPVVARQVNQAASLLPSKQDGRSRC
ncbi:hypothetical protein MTO96_001211 [Rhipicephalus appendiculatus]